MTLFIKRLLLLGLLAIVLVPVLQTRFTFVKEKPLGGAFTVAPKPEFSWDALRDNTYQPALEKHLEDSIGFRALFIRLRNQLAFSIFRVPHSGGIIVGRNDVLFGFEYLGAYAGKNLMPEDEIRFRVHRLRTIQQLLAERGIQLLYVIAPNKARFEPENLPDEWRAAPGVVTNYELFVRHMQEEHLNLLDCTALFAQWKHTKPYPLYPRNGTHWSGYGASLAADSLMRRIASLTGTTLPAVHVLGPPKLVYHTDSLRSTDNDLGETLNLLRERDARPMAYPRLAFDAPRPDQPLPSVLFVSDSFVWGLMQFSPFVQKQLAPDTRVWFYNQSVYMPDSVYHKTGEQAGDLDLRKEIESRKAIVLLFTEHNMTEQEYGFTERLYRLYHPVTNAEHDAVVKLAAELTKQASWEEASKDPDNFPLLMQIKAQAIYDRQMH
ncbi:alginate O-acetyltransferase AlgX-related protein [Hymenobacter convexus]|uniref:alginate O-acetyltransferase AlgX-related protein n=1 Tax=Hymenobacter sp. CA1UV-4 TaxID=3063782 RepID=UPI002713B558|nr:hypothetical protein [Hymenobacter sp. CA1UV-4]MDO7850299.1 hypothetical protein [Hymenobacter sp. CA1UV-4]